MKKKLLTVALAATMVVSSAMSAFAADPVVSYNFDDTSKMTMNGKAAVVANPEDAADKVLCVEEGAGGKNGNYASVDASVLSGIDFSNGLTVSMNIRPTANASDWNYLFGLGLNGATEDTTDTEVWKYIDGTIGFIQRKDGGNNDYVGYFPGDGWAEGNQIGGVANGTNPYNYFCLEENANKWYKMTYVYAKDSVSIYLDGVLTVTHAATGMDGALASVGAGNTFNLGAGIDKNLENYGGYIDDVMIYNKALTADEVAAIPAEVAAAGSTDNNAGSTDSNAGSTDTNTNAGTTTTPDTGDYTMVGLLLVVAAVSAVVVLKRRTVAE